MKHLIIALLFTTSLEAFSQADSSKPLYMYPFISVNAGYGTNLNSTLTKIVRPFWGTNGPAVNISALCPLKESYWGLAFMAGYCAPGFALSQYIASNASIPTNYSYDGESTDHYNICYLLGGLNIKLPQHTTRDAIELRLLVGPLVSVFPTITYYFSNHMSMSAAENANQITGTTCVAMAISPGIGIGHKLTKHIAVMAYADILLAILKYRTTSSESLGGNPISSTTSNVESDMNYVNFTAILAYSFGNIKANIVY